MLGCSYGRLFRTTVAGGSYQEGLTVHVQGVPPGLLITEEEIYSDLLLRKPGQGELASPRREPDIPILYSGVNAADTMPGCENRNRTNGTPLVILIPNLDRHFEHIEQYRATNRTPRPGHASYASYRKYGPCDDAIGAGFFSGRYTAGTCTFVITNGVIQSDDLEIRSSAMRLLYRGTTDLQQRVNARVEAELLRDVWLVGPVVSTVFWPVTKLFEYKVTDSLDQPKLEPLFLITKTLLLPFRPFHLLKGLFLEDSTTTSNSSRTNAPPSARP